MINTNKLKAVRVELGYTQEDVAKLMGIVPMTYQRKETGKRDFTASELLELSEILKLTLSDINEIFFNNLLTKWLNKEVETA